jgi:integrase
MVSLRKFFGNTKISEITPESIFQFQRSRLSTEVSPGTVNRDRAFLSRVLNVAKKRRLINLNPCENVEPLNEKRTRRKAIPFTYEEEKRITTSAAGWFRMFFILLIETGLRAKKEALPLKWDDVHFEFQPTTIFIRDSKSVAGIRPIFLTQYCKRELLQWKSMIAASIYLFPSPSKPGEHIRDYQDTWEQVAKSARVEGHILYDTRASFASRVNACGHTETTIARMLGHESTRLIPVYAKPIDENTRAIVRALDIQRAGLPKSSAPQ